ncbi:hypothetical protein [Bacillus sp. ISL-7]|uniref:hypothetical protein n=1 Tax=Bacillus sp. ISL-7 TaxID=2819136 RepID=UPI001BEADECC|nr:hypothetical protein [Bacillus sp. ISL-7]MBT2737630.1 hypothetical protein [Bacillus sp. ISL-7]
MSNTYTNQINGGIKWINYTQVGKDHCYASVERMAKDIGTSEKTFIKYTGILETAKFIKVVRHDINLDNLVDKKGMTIYYLIDGIITIT